MGRWVEAGAARRLDGHPDVFGPLLSPRRAATAPQDQAESGDSTRCHMLPPVPIGGVIRQGVVLTDLQSLLDGL